MTWKPDPGMTKKQIERELQRQAVLFEEKAVVGLAGNGAIKFEDFAEQWFKEYAAPALKPRTYDLYRQFSKRVYAAIGHIRLDRINARQIQDFINNLGESGVKKTARHAVAKADIKKLLSEKGMTQKDLAKAAGVGESTVATCCHGRSITANTAEKISGALQYPAASLFTFEKYEGSSLSPKAIKNYLTFVSSILNYAVKMGIIPENPCKRVALPRIIAHERDCYTLEETQKLLDLLQDEPIKYLAFFVLAIYGGFRRAEILGLEWGDIDFKNRVIHIRRSSLNTTERGTFTDTPKTKTSARSLKLPVEVFTVLQRLKLEQTRERLQLGDRWENTKRLFVTWSGKPMHPNTPYEWLKKLCAAHGLRFLGVHTFRHLNASIMIHDNKDIKTVSAALGHSQVSTTLNIYAHTMAEAQAEASEGVASKFILSRKIR